MGHKSGNFVIIVNDLCSILKNYGISEAYLE